ncbi:MAG: glycosyltransferase family 39 protein [Anaerolineae bacterium]|nr:glycosyltransferase family 39 protein [Anaerolineae bacterium]
MDSVKTARRRSFASLRVTLNYVLGCTTTTRYLIPVFLVLLAVALRWGYMAGAPRGMQFTHVDAQGYHQLAVNLLERGVFSMNTEPPYRVDNIRAPLYPLFVAFWYAIGGPDPDFVVWVNPLLDALTVAALLKLGALALGRRGGRLAALLYALNPSSWRFCNELLTEIFFGLLLTLALWWFARYLRFRRDRDALVCGVFFGAGILCKPNIQFLPLALGMLVLHGLYTRQRHWWRGAAVVAGVIALMLLPWCVRNAAIFGEFFYTRTFEDNLAHVSAVATKAHVNGENVAPWTPRWEELYDEIVMLAAQQYRWEPVPEATLSTRDRDLRLKQITATAREIVRLHPVDFFVSHTSSWLRSFIPQEHKFWYARLTQQDWAEIAPEGEAFGRALAALGRGRVGEAVRILYDERLRALPPLALAFWVGWSILYGAVAILFCRGALRMRPRLLALFLVITIFYVTFVPGPISQIRFRLPVTPLILLLAAAGMDFRFWIFDFRSET